MPPRPRRPRFLVEFLGGEAAVIQALSAKTEAQTKHIAPFCCVQSWPGGAHFFYNAQIGTLQYVVIKPVMAAVTFVLVNTGDYEDGSFSPSDGYVYVASVNNASQIWAMYCLVLFYVALKDELEPVRPVPKFLVVKAVVFFTFWQSVGLALLVHWGVIRGSSDYTADNVVTGTQDFLVCVEMFAAAVAHHYAFHYKDFYDAERGEAAPPMLRTLFQAVNVTDVYVDHVRTAVRKKRRARDTAGAALMSDRDDSGSSSSSLTSAGAGAGASAGAEAAPASPSSASSSSAVVVGGNNPSRLGSAHAPRRAPPGPSRRLGAARYGAVAEDGAAAPDTYTPPSPATMALADPLGVSSSPASRGRAGGNVPELTLGLVDEADAAAAGGDADEEAAAAFDEVDEL